MEMKTTTKKKMRPTNALATWQKLHSLNDRDAAATIGLSRNTFLKYRDNKNPPLTVRLALAAITQGLGPV